MNATATPADTIAKVRLLGRDDASVVLGVTGTNYELHLAAPQPVDAEVGKRIAGVIRGAVWKVDLVSKGGAYIEPLAGQPRRVQGRVVGALNGANAVVVEVCGCPIVGDLPERWQASQIAPGTPIALDLSDGATFEPAG